MRARMIRISGSPAKVDAGIDSFVKEAVPRVQGQDGYGGLRLLVDRSSGEAVVVGFWRDEAALDASRESLRSLRESQAETWGSGPPQIDEYEAAIQHRPKPTEKGNWVRLTTLSGDPAKVDAGINHFRSVSIPAIENLPGFRAAILLVNRGTGGSLVATVWDSKDDLDSSASAVTSVRDEAAQAVGAGQQKVENFEVEFAELLTPVAS